MIDKRAIIRVLPFLLLHNGAGTAINPHYVVLFYHRDCTQIHPKNWKDHHWLHTPRVINPFTYLGLYLSNLKALVLPLPANHNLWRCGKIRAVKFYSLDFVTGKRQKVINVSRILSTRTWNVAPAGAWNFCSRAIPSKILHASEYLSAIGISFSSRCRSWALFVFLGRP